jgi:hypothetical protein
MKVVVTGRPYGVGGEGDGAVVAGEGAGLVAGIGPGEPVVHKKYILNPPRRTRYRIGSLS